MLNLWTLCCTMLSELVGGPVVKELNCNSKDPWFKPWCCEVFGGGGYFGQDSPTQLLTHPDPPPSYNSVGSIFCEPN